MTERVSDDVLRRWVRILTPGQAALCEELLELRAKVRRDRRHRRAGVQRVASLLEHLDADPDGETDNDLLALDLAGLWDAFAPGTRARDDEGEE